MSGIVGIVGDVYELEYRLADMLRSLRHRGDCGSGFWVSSFVESRIGMAHCGRMVSETEEDVRQPYVDEEEQVVVAVDGDIYNYAELREELQAQYTFVTDSSVEVLSKAYRRWGEGCFARINGVFAIALYDRRADVLLMARDRYGVKPFYYTTCRGNLYFGSEIKSLFSAGLNRRISIERWAAYMLYGTYGPSYSTFWEGVSQLPAGALMRYNGYSLSENSWYDIKEEIERLVSLHDETALRTMLEQELRTFVSRCMSDVSVCGFRIGRRAELQILHNIAQHGCQSGKMRTFADTTEDVVEQSDVLPIWVAPSHVVEELQRMKSWAEEPFDGCETIVRTRLFRHARRQGMKVVCSGVGLDVLWQDVWDNSGRNCNYLYPHKLFSPLVALYAAKPAYGSDFVNEEDRNRYCELSQERLPHILRVYDRSSAEAGVSVRLPFLGGHLVALSFALPLVSRQNRKEFVAHYMPPNRKPIEPVEKEPLYPQWMSQSLKEWIAYNIEALSMGEVRELFDVKQLRRMSNNFCNNKPLDMALLWKCLSLQCQLGDE